MHAVVVNLTLTDADVAVREWRDQVVPRVSGLPGFVAGYWTRQGDSALSMGIWESEEAANAAADGVRSMAPAGATVDSVEVREVVASA
jgi:hypothetical protein